MHNLTESDLSNLIQAAQKGQQAAFMQLANTYHHSLRVFIAKRLNATSYVDDIAQETFIIAFEKLNKLEHPQQFTSWLCSIALNLIRNHNRKLDPLKQANDISLHQVITQNLESELTLSTDDNLILLLKSCIESLNQNIQMLLTQFYVNNIPLKDLAKDYQTKHSTLTMRLHRARALLKNCIEIKLSKELK